MRSIKPGDIPKGRTSSYYNPQLEIKRKNKQDVRRERGTYGGDRGDKYPHDTSAYTADMIDVKLLLNSVVSSQ